MTNQLLDAALRYADDGWEVFPLYGIVNGRCECGVKCADPGKHPRVKWSGAATTDPEQIERWWTKWPNANIGVATGARSGIYVVDVDNKESVDVGGGVLIGKGDDSLTKQEMLIGRLPETKTATTGSGGTHLVFSYPTEESSLPNRGGMLESVDTRGDGGYIVAPPSLHKSGNRYRWNDDSTPMNDLPSKWLAFVKESRKDSGGVDLEFPEGFTVAAGEGRHEWLHKVGSKLRGQNGLGHLALYGALAAYNRAVLVPPLEPREVEHIVESCMKYPVEGLNHQVIDDLDAPTLDEGDDLAVLLFDFMMDEPAPFKPLVAHIVNSGECMILGGPPNIGKTWAVMDMMLGIASGGHFANHFSCEAAPVLFVDEEGSRRGDWQRFQMLLAGREGLSASGIPLYTKIDSGVRLDTAKGQAQLARLIERYRPGAVFLDSLVRVHGGDESSNRGMAELFRVVKQMMVAYDATFIFTHHIRKPVQDGSADPLWMLRGAGDIQGFPDSIKLFLPGEESHEVKVVDTKMRNGPKLDPWYMRITVDEQDGTAKIGHLEADEGGNDIRTRLLKAVVASEAGFKTTEELAAATGLTPATVASHMKVLSAAGHINSIKRGGGWYHYKKLEDDGE